MNSKSLKTALIIISLMFLSGCLYPDFSSSDNSGGGSHPPQPPPDPPPGFSIDNWQWRNPLPQGNYLYDIAYGNGTYIAVGAAGTILNLSDGLEHTEVFLDIRSVAFGNGTFVAVGAGDAILTSVTGKTWTLQKPFDPTKFGYRNIAFGNSTFVAIDLRTVYTSKDNGVTWNSQDFLSPTGGYLVRLIFDNNLFVAIVDNRDVYRSSDGIAWSKATIPGSGIPSAITYGQGKFVVMSDRIYTSPDAVSWTAAGFINASHGISALAYGNGKFVAVGSPGYLGLIYTSADTITWNQSPDRFDFSLNQVAFLNGQFLSVGAVGLIIKSSEGETWTDLTSRVTHLPFLSVAYGNNIYLAAAYDQYITGSYDLFSSPDGIVWTKLTLLPEPAHRVKYMDGLFYAFCRFSVYSSADGSQWAKVSMLPVDYINDFIFVNNMYVAVGKGIVTSTDGISWTSRYTGPDFIRWMRIIFAKNTFVAIDNFADILVSQDGITWSKATVPFVQDDSFNDIVFGHDQFVVVSNRGSVYSSSDGTYWIQRVYGNRNTYLFNVISTPDGFVTVGNGVYPDSHGLVITSLNGISWASWSLTGNDIYGVAYGPNGYVAAGSVGFILQSNTITYYPSLPPMPYGF